MPALSVILITPDSFATVRATVKCLARQTVRDRLELVFVGPRPDQMALDAAEIAPFGGHRVVAGNPLESTALARAAGIRAASAPLVAMAEDHAFPEPEWAEALIDAHQRGWAGVGPSVVNANPSSAVSWANLLIQYGPWLEPATGGEQGQIPGHNSCYRRDVLLPYGDALGEWLEAESILQWDLQTRGHRFAIEPRARTRHQNMTHVLQSAKEHFYGGQGFAAARARRWPVRRRLFYACASPLIPILRFSRIFGMARRTARFAQFTASAPLVVFFLIGGGLGEALGYLAGPGDSTRRLSDMEFHRFRFVGSEGRRPS
jgi:hypothetical protein